MTSLSEPTILEEFMPRWLAREIVVRRQNGMPALERGVMRSIWRIDPPEFFSVFWKPVMR